MSDPQNGWAEPSPPPAGPVPPTAAEPPPYFAGAAGSPPQWSPQPTTQPHWGGPATPPPPVYPGPGYPVPAYATPGHPGAYALPALRGNRGLMTAMLILGAVYVLETVLRALTAPAAVHAFDRAAIQGVDTRLVHTPYEAVGALNIVVLPLWVVGSLWLYRAHVNAHVLAPGQMRRSTVWSWLGWWVPFVAWWFPKQIVDDSWRASTAHLPAGSSLRARSTGLWWGLWVTLSLISGYTTRVGFFVTAGSTSSCGSGCGVYSGHRGVNPGLEVLTALVAIAAYAAWVPVALALTRAQDALVRASAPAPWR